jgi:uncharacterized protein (DUF302 family)
MIYERKSGKAVEAAARDLAGAVERHGFGVLHSYDFKATLAAKGQPIEPECRVLEVCNPAQAREVLTNDITLNMALPCRLSVFERDGHTIIGMVPPSDVLGLISDSAELRKVADDVEATMKAIIDEAA